MKKYDVLESHYGPNEDTVSKVASIVTLRMTA